MRAKSGSIPASNMPSISRSAVRAPKLRAAAAHTWAMPMPIIIMGTRIRGGTFTNKMNDNGCHAIWAMGTIMLRSDAWSPTR